MDFGAIIGELVDADRQVDSEQLNSIAKRMAESIGKNELKVIDLVKQLDPVLTNGDHNIRLKGLQLLVQVLTKLPTNMLNEKEIDVMSEFMCLRLVDHSTMELDSLMCLSYFVRCENTSKKFNKDLLDTFKTKANVQKMNAKSRLLVYEIVKSIIWDKRRASNTIDTDLIYSFIHVIEGENNPENLLLCFNIVAFILSNFIEIEPFIDDIFEWLSSYYPIDYTPDESIKNDTMNLKRIDLVEALYNCFYANPLNSDNLQTLLLEKLDSNLASIKIESLKCLQKCYERFPLHSIKSYASTLWASIRMSCLKKPEFVDPKLLETSHITLTALTKKLSEDKETYFNFVTDMYEELAIAFRKPEMDLFLPAAQLLTHAILPELLGFNYVIGKILPVCISALSDSVLKVIPGLAYLFQQLHLNHPDAKLDPELSDKLSKLCVAVIPHLQDESSLTLIEAMIYCRTITSTDVLNQTIARLWELFNYESQGVENCLALICMNYNRFDILGFNDVTLIPNLEEISRLSRNFTQENSGDFGLKSDSDQSKRYSVFLRTLLNQLDISTKDQLATAYGELDAFMQQSRDILQGSRLNEKIVEKVALSHFTIINKSEQSLLDSFLMKYFASDYCQKLVPENPDDYSLTKDIYLVTLHWIFKALVLRNHPHALPLVNLLLNFISSDKLNQTLALEGCKIFTSIQSDSNAERFSRDKHYNIFALYKQKFFVQCSKEIKIRYEKQTDKRIKRVLLCAMLSHVPQLPFSIFKNEADWLIRQSLVLLSDSEMVAVRENEDLLDALYTGLESLLKQGKEADMSNFLHSLVGLCLNHSTSAKTMRVRKRALDSLLTIAGSFKDSELLILRASVIDGLRKSLSDKKRLVRESAAAARLKWVLVGQPIG